ncbi:neuropeptide FF receptor 2-like [Acropora palmata]|uniref:neuropeptide FF receptor 2-like n=1 Tax=Acropora palmata TaxID=6131 RepID=UPI003DA14C89
MAFNNSSFSSSISNPFVYNTSERVIIILANTLIFCLAIPANSIVIIVISTVQNARTPTSTFLLNLCVADIIMALLYIPFITVDLYAVGHWVFGDFMCKLVSFAYYLATYSSILILTAISVERYISVCISRRLRLTAKKVLTTTLVLWTCAACVALPLFVVKESFRNPSLKTIEFCIVTWSRNDMQIYTLVTQALFYVIPIVFMVIVYYKIARKVWTSAEKTRSMRLSNKHTSNSKLRLTKISIAIILSFVISWTPLNTITVLFFFAKRSFPFSADTARVVFPITYWIAFSNCALNPLLYCYMSQNFRKAFKIFCHRRSQSSSLFSKSISTLMNVCPFGRRSKKELQLDRHLPNEWNDVPGDEKETPHPSEISQGDLVGLRETILFTSTL